MVTKADYIGIVVEDVEKAREFYEKKLKLEVNEACRIPGEFAAFKLEGGAMFAVQKSIQCQGKTINQPFEPALAVDDIGLTYADFVSAGVKVLEEPHELPFGLTFLFQAPEGHVMRVYQPNHN